MRSLEYFRLRRAATSTQGLPGRNVRGPQNLLVLLPVPMKLTLIIALGLTSQVVLALDWMASRLDAGRPEFVAIRRQIQQTYGQVPEGAPPTSESVAAAVKKMASTKKPEDVFSAIYLKVCAGDRQLPPGALDPWKILPEDDIEVARLHFLWADNEAAKPLGDRIIAKTPSDAEVLCALSWLYSHVGKKPSWNPAKGV